MKLQLLNFFLKMTEENMEQDIKYMSIPEILKYIHDVLEFDVKDPLPRLKCQALLKEIQKRITYLWGAGRSIDFTKQRHCDNCGIKDYCKPLVDNSSCPYWQPQSIKQ